ncbi:protein tyrosine phosphatase, partial [Klebsiella pneumoniae]|uniref:arsenate reductase/protein-tyrosine-phosphatase family protein n=1 Tax=Klebsiella pneumoniae TaxID=573 RepID=UPI000E5BF560
SAGVGALIWNSADPSAIAVAEKYHLSLDGHVGKQLSSSMARSYDLILVMEKHHLEQVTHISPESRGKTMLLGHWMGGKEIPDPYRKSDEAFDLVYQLINQACRSWAEKMGQ